MAPRREGGFKASVFAICVAFAAASVINIQVEDFAEDSSIDSKRVFPRSEAGNKRTVWLFSGECVSITVCLPEDDIVTISNVKFSNDGESDIVVVDIDENIIGSFNSSYETSFGSYWNIFEDTGPIGRLASLPAGSHVLTLTVVEADDYGVELDEISVVFGENYRPDDILCPGTVASKCLQRSSTTIDNSKGGIGESENGFSTTPTYQDCSNSSCDTTDPSTSTGNRRGICNGFDCEAKNEDGDGSCDDSGCDNKGDDSTHNNGNVGGTRGIAGRSYNNGQPSNCNGNGCTNNNSEVIGGSGNNNSRGTGNNGNGRGTGNNGSDSGTGNNGDGRGTGNNGSDRGTGNNGNGRGTGDNGNGRGTGNNGSGRGTGDNGSDSGTGNNGNGRGTGDNGSDSGTGDNGNGRGTGDNGNDSGTGNNGNGRGSGDNGSDSGTGNNGDGRGTGNNGSDRGTGNNGNDSGPENNGNGRGTGNNGSDRGTVNNGNGRGTRNNGNDSGPENNGNGRGTGNNGSDRGTVNNGNGRGTRNNGNDSGTGNNGNGRGTGNNGSDSDTGNNGSGRGTGNNGSDSGTRNNDNDSGTGNNGNGRDTGSNSNNSGTGNNSSRSGTGNNDNHTVTGNNGGNRDNGSNGNDGGTGNNGNEIPAGNSGNNTLSPVDGSDITAGKNGSTDNITDGRGLDGQASGTSGSRNTTTYDESYLFECPQRQIITMIRYSQLQCSNGMTRFDIFASDVTEIIMSIWKSSKDQDKHRTRRSVSEGGQKDIGDPMEVYQVWESGEREHSCETVDDVLEEEFIIINGNEKNKMFPVIVDPANTKYLTLTFNVNSTMQETIFGRSFSSIFTVGIRCMDKPAYISARFTDPETNKSVELSPKRFTSSVTWQTWTFPFLVAGSGNFDMTLNFTNASGPFGLHFLRLDLQETFGSLLPWAFINPTFGFGGNMVNLAKSDTTSLDGVDERKGPKMRVRMRGSGLKRDMTSLILSSTEDGSAQMLPKFIFNQNGSALFYPDQSPDAQPVFVMGNDDSNGLSPFPVMDISRVDIASNNSAYELNIMTRSFRRATVLVSIEGNKTTVNLKTSPSVVDQHSPLCSLMLPCWGVGYGKTAIISADGTQTISMFSPWRSFKGHIIEMQRSQNVTDDQS